MSINRVELSGNLTRDPESRQTAGGTFVMGFGLAVNERVKGQDGEWTDRPNFVDCTMFGTRAEKLIQWMRKGTKVALAGKLHYSSWERDGQRRSKLEVVVDDIELMNRSDGPGATHGSNAGNHSSASQTAPQKRQQKPTGPQQMQADLYDEDIPF